MNAPTLNSYQRVHLWRLIQLAAQTDLQTYRSEWLPYMESFSHHFMLPLCDIYFFRDLERAVELVPFGHFRLRSIMSTINVKNKPRDLNATAMKSVTAIEVDIASVKELAVMIASPHVTELTSIKVNRPHRDLDQTADLRDFFDTCAQGPVCDTLEELSWGWYDWDADSVALISKLPWKKLHALNLGAVDFRGKAWNIFLQSSLMGCIKHMTPKLSSRQVMKLASSPATNLESLNLSFCTPSPEALVKLLTSRHLSGIKKLDLSSISLKSKKMKEAFVASTWKQLECFKAERCDITDQWLTTVSNAPLTRAIKCLSLNGNRLTAKGMAQFRGDGVEDLDVSGSPLASSGLSALVNNPSCGSLKSLHIRSCDVGTDGFRALATSDICQDLNVLRLGYNKPGAKGLKVLLDAKNLSQLDTLEMISNQLNDDRLKEIANSPLLSQLGSLSLEHNDFTQEGVAHIANSPHVGNLYHLGLNVTAASKPAFYNSSSLGWGIRSAYGP